jgi:hypothetical protein
MSGDPLPCPQCPGIATSLCKYVDHIKKNHGMKRVLCPKCPKDMDPKRYYSRTMLYDHVKKEHAEEGFVVCNDCQDPILKDKLIEHLKFHAKTFGHFSCPFPSCRSSFHGRTVENRYRAIYLQHKLKVHQNRSIPSVHLVNSDNGKV